MTSTGFFMLLTLAVYFSLLLLVAKQSAKKNDNDTFFRAGRRSPWWMVAFGMIGASMSGVSFISVPGWVGSTGMTYLQMCAGFCFGYFAVAFILLPLYYKLELTSIYAYLGMRYGISTHRTGAFFFLLSKLTGAAARLYLVCLVLQEFVMGPLGIPYPATAAITLLLIWGYTQRSGTAALVRTDALQTACLLLAMVALVAIAAGQLGYDFNAVWTTVKESPMSKVFEWDPSSKQAFWRQFLSGIFIVIVMTGLDQDMMQKNLTCRTLKEAQKDMCAYGLCFLPVNFILLALGILLHAVYSQNGIALPGTSDELLPFLISSGTLGTIVILPFTIGIVAAAFSSADSALTALTTSCCIDVLDIEKRHYTEQQANSIRKKVHIAMAVALFICICAIYSIGSQNVIDTIYVLAGYTYGPLLGLYGFGLLSRRQVIDKKVPFVALAAPIICGILDFYAPRLWNYHFGYELLMLNGLLTYAGLWCITKKDNSPRMQPSINNN